MKRAAGALGAHDEPFAIGSLIAEDREEVLAEAVWWPVGCVGVGARGANIHLAGEEAVEEIEGGLVRVGAEVGDVR